MAKRKASTALFEVISRTDKAGVRTPSWIRPGDRPADEQRASVPLHQPAGLDGMQPTARPHGQVEPLVRIDGRHLRLTFGSVSGAIAAVVALLLLGGAYKVGHLVGHRAAAGRTASAGVPSLFDGGDGAAGYSYDAAQQEALRRLDGKDRVLVVAENIASAQDARAIHRYLWSEGLMPYVLRDEATGRFSVLDTADLGEMAPEDVEQRREALMKLGRKASWPLKDTHDFSRSRVSGLRRDQ